MTDYALEVRRRNNLEAAWRHIRASGWNSDSREIRNEIRNFDSASNTNLNRIHRQLREVKFDYGEAIGIPKKKGSGEHRPIVIAPLETRIVQRSVLDVLQNEPAIRGYFDNKNSFGGIKGRAVPEAVEEAVNGISAGFKYFIRSDIAGFFTGIPRLEVLAKINRVISDPAFSVILESCTQVELANLASLRKHKSLFPSHEVGVAQGCCLSPLLGNILLSEFDQELNSKDGICLRYIDDFLILAPNKNIAFAKYNRALEIIGNFGLTAYDPRKSGAKAECGQVDGGFDFLGVNMKNRAIRPSKASRKKITRRIRQLLDDRSNAVPSEERMADWDYNQSYVDTLHEVSNILRGWSNQYKFCNEDNVFLTLDHQIDLMLSKCSSNYHRKARKLHQRGKRRLLGVRLMTDRIAEPIEWKSTN